LGSSKCIVDHQGYCVWAVSPDYWARIQISLPLLSWVTFGTHSCVPQFQQLEMEVTTIKRLLISQEQRQMLLHVGCYYQKSQGRMHSSLFLIKHLLHSFCHQNVRHLWVNLINLE
jgi:hypothetical protein